MKKDIEKIGEVFEGIEEAETDVIQEKLDNLQEIYDRVLKRLEEEVQTDRVQAQKTYDQANQVVQLVIAEANIPQPSLLQALNGAMKNVQDSTQREYSILQEVSKAKQALEELQELGMEEANATGDFHRDEFL